jgi:hypothetical protein
MRLTSLLVLIAVCAVLLTLVRRLFAIGPPTSGEHGPMLDAESEEVIRLAQALAGADAQVTVGHLLLALASRPGDHLKVLPNATVLACAVRVRLGLATRRHRLILACDRPKLVTRRIHLRLDREVATHRNLSLWRLAWLTYGLAGAAFATATFPITVLATALLYLFLWPAALLMAGVRALCGRLAGCDVRSRHWLEIPGGDVALTPRSRPVSPRAVTATLLAPRLFAGAICVIALAALLWRSKDLGVVISPVVFRRPDILTGAAPEGIWLAPLVILAGMLEQNGTAAGVGLLAGLGAGMMSIPTFREVELIRLYAGHDVGGGPRLARALTSPASLFTGAVACIEAILPFTGSPIYATAYVVPLLLSALAAVALLQVAPF